MVNYSSPTAVSTQTDYLSDQDGNQIMSKATVTLTSAQVLALFTTPITLIAAPGAGKFIQIFDITAKMTYKSATYAGANALEIRYTNAAGVKVSADIPTSFINSASSVNYVGTIAAGVIAANVPVVAAVPTANPTTGNSAITLEIFYAIRNSA